MSTPIRACAWRRRLPAIAALSAPTRCPAVRDLDEADCRAGRLQRRLVPSGAVPAHAGGPAERGARIVVVDPRRTATGDEMPISFSPIAPGTDTVLFSGPAGPSRRPAALDHRLSSMPHDGFRARLRAPGEIAPEHLRRRARNRLTPRDVARSSNGSRDAKVRHVLLAGRQPVGARHRQGQRHHQLPSRHRPHRPTRHGAVLAHRPAQCDGRPRGRRSRQSARRAYGLHAPEECRPRRRFWNAPRMAQREGLKAVRCSRRSSAARSRRCG
jgi:assimilatory nitrate reductase catalytic subunit